MTTPRCCSTCRHLGQSNIPRTGRLCYGQPAVGLTRPVIANKAQSTFYCAAWNVSSPGFNPSVPQDVPDPNPEPNPELARQNCTHPNVDRFGLCLDCGFHFGPHTGQ